jgi:hypothetical protein
MRPHRRATVFLENPWKPKISSKEAKREHQKLSHSEKEVATVVRINPFPNSIQKFVFSVECFEWPLIELNSLIAWDTPRWNLSSFPKKKRGTSLSQLENPIATTTCRIRVECLHFAVFLDYKLLKF